MAATAGDAPLLRAGYAVWAVAALSRAAYQYLYRQPETLAPTHISALAGGLYLLILLAMRRRTPGGWALTLALLAAELAGVLLVGAADVFWGALPYATVWSGFGAGYLFVPLVLPVVGIGWMLRASTRSAYGVRS